MSSPSRQRFSAPPRRMRQRPHQLSTLWCRRCRMCRGGAENLCLDGELMGFDHPGAYAERVVIPNIALKNLFRIPDGLSAAHAALARLQGAGQVLLLERTAARLELAREILGDDRVAYVDTDDEDAQAAVSRATGEFGADVVIVACSS